MVATGPSPLVIRSGQRNVGGYQKPKVETADLLKLTLLLICLILSAFFSSSETAFIALPRARLLHLVNTGHHKANLVSRLIRRPERLLATVLLGNNLVNTAAAAVGTALAINLIGNDTAAVLVSTFGVTFLLLVFSEALPKSIAWNRPQQVAFAYCRPLVVLEWLLSPAIFLLQGITSLFIKVLGVHSPSSQVNEEEIRTLIALGAQSGDVDRSEAALLEKVFRFGDRQIREIITPRPEIIWITPRTTLEELLSVYLEHSHTRFPVCEDSVDNVLGVLAIKDVLTALGRAQLQRHDSVGNLMRPAYFAPETSIISDTFSAMREKGVSLVLAVDEFGGIAGLATLKQLSGVIVGEMGEEGSAPEEPYAFVDDYTFHLDAGVGISEINDKLNVNLPEGSYQTVAGFILDRLGRIPQEGDVVEYHDLRLTVKTMDGVRIAVVELLRLGNLEGGANL